jgi:hypothetical protein
MKKILKCLIIVPVLFLLVTLFGCSEVMANEKPFSAARECNFGTFFFTSNNIYKFDSNDGDFKEEGVFEAQTDTIGITTILITINKSNIINRSGLTFTCTAWDNDPKINYEFWFNQPNPYITWLTNAKTLTIGLADSDTIPSFPIPVTVERNKTTWSKVKQLFITK